MRPRRRWGTQFRHSKIHPCRQASNDSREKATTTSSPSVVTAANPTFPPQLQKTSSSTRSNSPASATTSKSSATSSCPARPSPHQRTAGLRGPALEGTPIPQTLSFKACRFETLLADPLLRFQRLHPQQAGRKAEVHAPQPRHPRPCRKTRGLALVELPSLSSGRTRPSSDIPALTKRKRIAPSRDGPPYRR
jgi:hypothetical protein